MHLMTEEQFAWNKARWEEIKHEINNPEAFDQGIVEALELINKVPELTTVFSCQGHPNPEIKVPDFGYIMIGVKNEVGVAKVHFLYSLLAVNFKNLRHMVRLTLTERGDIRFNKDDPKSKDAWWNVWIINWPVYGKNPDFYYQKVVSAATQAFILIR